MISLCALWWQVGWRSLQDGLQSRVGKARSRTKGEPAELCSVQVSASYIALSSEEL